jgi:hypothetical protein
VGPGTERRLRPLPPDLCREGRRWAKPQAAYQGVRGVCVAVGGIGQRNQVRLLEGRMENEVRNHVG